MKTTKILTAMVVVLALIYVPQVYGLNEGTHRRMNARISAESIGGFSLHDYLINELDIPEGIHKILRGRDTWYTWRVSREIRNWIAIGGLYEDRPPLGVPWGRAFNHFLNPLTNKGFAYFPGTVSAKEWAFKPVGTQILDGNNSWYDARDYFYKSLTLANKNDREEHFAVMFRSLGQLMHLVQDMSVPDHTRDDGHVLPGYESWVDNYGDIHAAPLYFEQLLQMSGTPLPPGNLFDTDQYNGQNPTITTGPVGLAEYTNANFLSSNTIEGSFPYPKITKDTPIVVRPYAGPTGIHNREYFLKDRDGETNNGAGYLLAVVDINEQWRNHPLVSDDIPSGPTRILDENVHLDYSKLLVPRAIGYSAEILDYFFRGKLDFEQTDTKPSGEIEISIKNLSDDSLGQGIFEFFYDSEGMRKKIELSQFSVNDLSRDSSFKTTFVPPGGKENQYILVYVGKMGKEEWAVIGKCKSLDCCKSENKEPLTLGYTSLVMGCGKSQTFVAEGGCPPYTWTLVSGGGTLTDNGDGTAAYTAPASNPNCSNNPIINLKDCCEETEETKELKLAINCYTPAWPAYRQCEGMVCIPCHTEAEYGDCVFGGIFGAWRYACDGTLLSSSFSNGDVRPIPDYDCQYTVQPDGFLLCGGDPIGIKPPCQDPSSTGWWSPCGGGWLDYYDYPSGGCRQPDQPCGTVLDLRTETMISQGCCPINPITGLPF